MECFRPEFVRQAWNAFTGPVMWVEMTYFFIVFIASMLIYFKTKKLYELSQHKGIELFRNAFLFFGIATLVKLLIRAERLIIQGSPHHSIYYISGLFLMSVFGTMSVLCLLGSITWKRMPSFSKMYLFLIISGAVSFVIPFIRGKGQLFLVLSQTIIFMIAAALSYWNHLGAKKKSNLYIIYLLIMLSWVMNLAAQFWMRTSLNISIILYAFSAAFFVMILYKVIKTTK